MFKYKINNNTFNNFNIFYQNKEKLKKGKGELKKETSSTIHKALNLDNSL